MRRNFVKATVLSVVLANPVLANPVLADAGRGSGVYLATTAGLRAGDFSAVADYAAQALRFDPDNVALQFSLAEALLILGDVGRATEIATAIEAPQGVAARLTNMLVVDQALSDRDFATLQSMLDAGPVVMPIFDRLLSGWVAFGQGRLSDALDSFAELEAERGEVGVIAGYHRGLMLAMIGNLEGATTALRDGGAFALGEESLALLVGVLVQQGERQAALDLIAEVDPDGGNAVLSALRERIETEQPLPDYGVTSEGEGVARAFLAIALVYERDDERVEALRYARMAELMAPELAPASLLVAELFQRLELADEAILAYARIPSDDPRHQSAVLQQARLLARQGRHDDALAAIMGLDAQAPATPTILMAKGDQLRRMERYQEAVTAYEGAIAAYGNAVPWTAYFARGIAYERLDDWPRSEADLRAAMTLNPNEALILNYLGYSMVEEGEDLTEALSLIERAVAADPNSGAIVDSLGWVLYRMGRYDEAVRQLERAVELEPTDPVINDHLGDAFWQVGRQREARFQWRRALSFEPEPDEVVKIRNKLDRGLPPVAPVTAP